jgi:hypothetical protein
MTPLPPSTTSESFAFETSSTELPRADEMLIPESRLVSSFLWTDRVGPKAASDTVVALLAHLKFLALGALGVGLLFVSSRNWTGSAAHSLASESLSVDDDSVTIPVSLSAMPVISSQPSDRTPQPSPPSERSPARPGTPLPPSKICINDQCSTTP